jgi:hypothetical protein
MSVLRPAVLCLPVLLAWTSLLLRVMQEGGKKTVSQGGPKTLPIHLERPGSPSDVRTTPQNVAG